MNSNVKRARGMSSTTVGACVVPEISFFVATSPNTSSKQMGNLGPISSMAKEKEAVVIKFGRQQPYQFAEFRFRGLRQSTNPTIALKKAQSVGDHWTGTMESPFIWELG
ncbi:hypothetical protein OUZ56_004637 [Daphnia magna]|uniref:Uncharacterized protein n=1 Tax=Daphnia magna TaxID=35525 RepID=A0ABQ9YQE0_9CRUS|nr:hypothetical protein OUZ56_004637 [Daphnia magna]